MSYLTLKDLTINESELLDISNRENITIGSHTFSHPILTKCDEKTVDVEIGGSKNMIENKLNRKVNFFAYPNGCFRSREINKVIAFKYTGAFTTLSATNTLTASANVVTSQLTGFLYGNNNSPVTASTTIPSSAVVGFGIVS